MSSPRALLALLVLLALTSQAPACTDLLDCTGEAIGRVADAANDAVNHVAQGIQNGLDAGASAHPGVTRPQPVRHDWPASTSASATSSASNVHVTMTALMLACLAPLLLF